MGCLNSGQSTASSIRRMSMSSNLRKQQILKMQKQLQSRQNQIQRLEQKNQTLKRQKQQQTQPHLHKNYFQPKIAVDVQAFQNNDDDDTELRAFLKCTLCQNEYDLQNRIPMMVCKNQHTYCSECTRQMLARKRDACPECRVKMQSGNQNLHLTQLLRNINKKDFNKNTLIKSNHARPKKLNISINRNVDVNKFLNKFNIINESNSLMKMEDMAWYGLICNQIIPVIGKFYFCFEVIMSNHNNIQVGIIDMTSKVEKGKMSNKRITYHLHDGKIMDSGDVQVANTKWREGGIKAPMGNIKIKVEVNMDDNEIIWMVNGGKILAKTVITNYIKYIKPVPYISMYHIDDIIKLNEE